MLSDRTAGHRHRQSLVVAGVNGDNDVVDTTEVKT
jgi:hypothetical protein